MLFDLLLIVVMIGVLAPFIIKKEQNKIIHGYKMSFNIIHIDKSTIWQVAILPQEEPNENQLLELSIYLDDVLVDQIDDITPIQGSINTYSGVLENLSRENKTLTAELTILDENAKQNRSIELSYITSNPIVDWIKDIFNR